MLVLWGRLVYSIISSASLALFPNFKALQTTPQAVDILRSIEYSNPRFTKLSSRYWRRDFFAFSIRHLRKFSQFLSGCGSRYGVLLALRLLVTLLLTRGTNGCISAVRRPTVDSHFWHYRTWFMCPFLKFVNQPSNRPWHGSRISTPCVLGARIWSKDFSSYYPIASTFPGSFERRPRWLAAIRPSSFWGSRRFKYLAIDCGALVFKQNGPLHATW